MNCRRNAIRAIVMLLCVTMLIGVMPMAVSAASGVKVEVGSVTVDYSAGSTTALVPIRITENSGFISLQLDVEYDDKSMTLTGWTEGDIFPYQGNATAAADKHHKYNYTAYSKADFASNPFRVMYTATDAEATSDITKTGTLITLKFNVTGMTGSELPVSAKIVNALSQGTTSVSDPTKVEVPLPTDITASCSTTAGKIDITGYKTGSVDGNGVINNNDIIVLVNHIMWGDDIEYGGIADLNKDGRVNNGDIISLVNHIMWGDDLTA